MDMFSDEPACEVKAFKDYALAGDKKGAIDYLRKLNRKEFSEEVYRAGFSMIGYHHGKPEVIKHVIRQFK
jgi:hypothetical protein